ncbi:hypothetical protein NPIL_24481, partial [Nephila pilipes]
MRQHPFAAHTVPRLFGADPSIILKRVVL